MEETNFGKNLKYLIKSTKGMTQKELADELGLKSNSAISSYVTGDGYPTVIGLMQISKIFKVSTDDLLFKDLTKHPKKSIDTPEVNGNQNRYEAKGKSHFDSHENVVKELYRLAGEVEFLKTIISNRDKQNKNE